MQITDLVQAVLSRQKLTSETEKQITQLVRSNQFSDPDLEALEKLLIALREGAVQRCEENSSREAQGESTLPN